MGIWTIIGIWTYEGEGEETRNQKGITWSENKENQSYIRCKILIIFQKVGGIKAKALQ